MALTTDWDSADNDGLELAHSGDLDVGMHPDGYTDPPLFITYDKSKDHKPNSQEHKTWLSTEVLPDLMSRSAGLLNLRDGVVQPPGIPPEAKQAAALIGSASGLPLLGQGYKALAEGNFDLARDVFARMRSATNSPLEQAEADAAIARTELFAGNFDRAAEKYQSAQAYLPSTELTAERAVTASMSGRFDFASALLNQAEKQNKEPSAQGGFLYGFGTPFRKVGLAPSHTVENPALAIVIPTTLALTYEREGDVDNAKRILDNLLPNADKLSKSQSPRDRRIAALTYANAAELSALKDDKYQAAHFFGIAAGFFEGINDSSSEYQTMLKDYVDVLNQVRKPQEAAEQMKLLQEITDKEI